MLIIVDKFQFHKSLIQLKHLDNKLKLRILSQLSKLKLLLINLISKHLLIFLDIKKHKVNHHLNNFMIYLILMVQIVLVLKILKEFVIWLVKSLQHNKLII